MASDSDLWKVSVAVRRRDVAHVEALLANALGGQSYALDGPGECVLAVTANALADTAKAEPHQLWRIEVLCADEPDIEALAEPIRSLADAGITIKPRVERVPSQDWLLTSQSSFQPIRAGRFFVHPSHAPPLPGTGALNLMINAGPAFGTGTHESTFGCLIALDDLAKRKRVLNPLDLGSGSGILSMAIARTWNCRVLGVDVDPRAIEFARTTAAMNQLHRQVTFFVSNGCRNYQVLKHRPYDLIVANILADPLIWMASDIKRHLAPGGRVILSGILRHQEQRVLGPYRLHRLFLEKRVRIRGWSTLVLRSPGRGAFRSSHGAARSSAAPEISEVSFF